MTVKNIIAICSMLTLIACACNNKTSTSKPIEAYQKISPDFNGDSAYAYVDKQVAFGPRVPNTQQHVACGDYLVSELKRFGADVQEQKMVVTAYDGTKLNARNIIGSYGLDKAIRVLLFAHWDTRPYSDRDADKANYNKPLLGANDGGSGVGVLLEVARIVQSKAPEVGIDIIFFDAEDYGTPVFKTKADFSDKWWCLGSQYWANNPHVKDYKAKYGILLDMVGGIDAKFYKEAYSKEYAANVVEKVWSTAGKMGYGKYFIGKDGGMITDDHVPVNQIRRIPSIDIIQYDLESDHGFASYWHTQQDDMRNVSKETLTAVGQTVLEVIYNEK
ncbi:M28 family peptidase [Prevotella sp. 10(H)]|uniref:M28 family peptidase n=1 Tax=Prevotella sp. 10(H) TaxID=1158294 RepID=UPI0004A78227|nr:M28 family peptidase [Prevotella sp. 10(H)]